jgi:hypothetical protein
MQSTVSPSLEQPKFVIGQRIQEGTIISIERYPFNRKLVEQYNQSWRYGVLTSQTSDSASYFLEHQIHPISEQEAETKIIAEIDWCLKRLVTLQQELGADLRIRTPWGNIPQLPTVVHNADYSTSRLSEPIREKVSA